MIHNDVKPENIMIKRHGDARWVFKLVDLGNAYRIEDHKRPGGTMHYCAPETVVGFWNIRSFPDVFSLGLVLVEVLFRQSLIPRSILDSYSLQNPSPEAAKITQLFHLVFLSSIVAGREVWAGNLVRQHYGKYPKDRLQKQVLQAYPCAKEEISTGLVRREESRSIFDSGANMIQNKLRQVRQMHPGLYKFLRTALQAPAKRPSPTQLLANRYFSPAAG